MADEGKKTDQKRTLSRRDLLRTAGAAGAAALLPGAASASEGAGQARSTVAPAALSAPAAPAGPLMNLTARETEILAAMVDRLIPSDDMGPGAIEAGALRFIDRLLSEEGEETVEDYRTGIAALDAYALYSRGASFTELSEQDKDSVLIDVQIGGATGAGTGFAGSSGSFFNMVKGDVWQGVFGDPQYGGNVNFIGWDILNYPGVRMRVSDEDQALLDRGELPPARRSAYDYGQFQMDGGA